MRKILTLMVALMMCVLTLAGCGSSGSGSAEAAEPLSVDSLKTIADVTALEKEENQTAVYDGKYVSAFKYGDTYYRVIADLPKEVEDAYINIDFSEEDYEQQQADLVADIEVDKVEDLTDQILTDEDIEALAGKTGAQMVEDGWSYTGSFNLDGMEVYMNYGPFEYIVTFDGDAGVANAEDYDIEAGTKDMKVKSVAFNTLGDATNME